MPKKTKDKRKKHGKVDPVEFQFGIKTKAKVSKEAIDEAIKYWALNGRAPRGFRMSYVRWRNPVRKDESLAVWKEETTPAGIAHARTTLRLRQLLRKRPNLFQKVG
jgi:hypothetical protein